MFSHQSFDQTCHVRRKRNPVNCVAKNKNIPVADAQTGLQVTQCKLGRPDPPKAWLSGQSADLVDNESLTTIGLL